MNLAAEYTKKVLSEYLESRQNEDITDLHFIKLKGLSSPELAPEEKKDYNLALFDLSGSDIYDSLHGRS